MASNPHDREFSNLVDFDAAHLPPGPDGVPRAGDSAFPTTIDMWPAHADGWDEKMFAKYMHDVYCAIIQLQRTLKNGIMDAGAVHVHKQFVVAYAGDPVIEITDIPLDSAFLSGSVSVAFRGKVLAVGVEWEEVDDLRHIRLFGSHPDTEAIDDLIVISYAVPLSL